MTVEKVIAAHRAFGELLTLRLPYGRVRQLRRLAAWLEEELDSYCAEERGAAEEWGAEIEEGVALRFPDATAREGYLARVREARDTPVDGWPRVTLSGEELGDQEITLQAVMDLEGFVELGGDDLGAV